MVRSVLKYGSVKAKFTANATYHQTLAVPAAQAVKVAVRKVQHHLAVAAATKEAANVVVSAEAVDQVVTEEADQAVVETNAVVAVTVRVDKVVDQIAVAAIVPVAHQEEDNINKSSRDRHRLDIKA